jgi:hypothetical protein
MLVSFFKIGVMLVFDLILLCEGYTPYSGYHSQVVYTWTVPCGVIIGHNNNTTMGNCIYTQHQI